MQLQNRWAIFLSSQAVLSIFWGIGFIRAYNFYTYTHSVLAQTNSANAAGDFRFSKAIIFCYGVSFVIGTLIIWFVSQRRHPVFVFSAIGVYLIVLSVLAAKPEAVIVMFPDLAPFIALLASVILGLIGMATALILKFRRR